MNNAPFCYDYINANVSPITPSTMRFLDNGLFQYFKKYLLQKAISVFKWQIPELWSKNYCLNSLYTWGTVAVFNTAEYGTVCQACGLNGYDLYYQPTHAVISNPVLGGFNLKIGRECEIIKLQPNYSGIMDIIDCYAKDMAMAWQTIDTNLLNSKISYVFTARGKTAAESFKKMYDRIASGEPAVVVDKNLYDDSGKMWDSFAQNVKENYIVSDILEDIRKIELSFDTDIGIPNSNTDKKERMLVDEINSNNIETYCKAALWLDELRTCVDKVNAMFNTDISVDWRRYSECYNVDSGAVQLGEQSI